MFEKQTFTITDRFMQHTPQPVSEMDRCLFVTPNAFVSQDGYIYPGIKLIRSFSYDLEFSALAIKPEIGERYIGIDCSGFGTARLYLADDFQRNLDPRSRYNVRITFERVKNQKGVARFCESTGKVT